MYTEDDNLPPIGPRSSKFDEAIARIRQQIIGSLKPEARLPSFNEMEQQLGVSRTVVREAINELKRDGFIYSIERQGLFVAGRPPYLSRFGLVFSNSPAAPNWPRFHTALQSEAAAIQQERGDISFVSYYDITPGSRTESFRKLMDDLRRDRLAGVMLMPRGHAFWQSEPLASLSVPRVYIWGATEVGRVPSIGVNETQMCERMASWLQQRGRSRLAAVSLWGNHESPQRWLEQRNLLNRGHWFQTVARDNASEIRRIVQLLMDYPADQRPDGLMILDDNLTENAVGGLLECGLRIGQDLDVIAHCNWPWPVPTTTPIQRVGYHARHILSLAIRAIELQRQHQPLACDRADVPALFESEVRQPFDANAFDPVSEVADALR